MVNIYGSLTWQPESILPMKAGPKKEYTNHFLTRTRRQIFAPGYYGYDPYPIASWYSLPQSYPPFSPVYPFAPGIYLSPAYSVDPSGPRAFEPDIDYPSISGEPQSPIEGALEDSSNISGKDPPMKVTQSNHFPISLATEK